MNKGKCPSCGKNIKIDQYGCLIYHEVRVRISKKSVDVGTCPGSGEKPKG
jgi:hypothetical protein